MSVPILRHRRVSRKSHGVPHKVGRVCCCRPRGYDGCARGFGHTAARFDSDARFSPSFARRTWHASLNARCKAPDEVHLLPAMWCAHARHFSAAISVHYQRCRDRREHFGKRAWDTHSHSLVFFSKPSAVLIEFIKRHQKRILAFAGPHLEAHETPPYSPSTADQTVVGLATKSGLLALMRFPPADGLLEHAHCASLRGPHVGRAGRMESACAPRGRRTPKSMRSKLSAAEADVEAQQPPKETPRRAAQPFADSYGADKMALLQSVQIRIVPQPVSNVANLDKDRKTGASAHALSIVDMEFSYTTCILFHGRPMEDEKKNQYRVG